MYNKKFQRIVASIIAGILVIAMLATGIISSINF